MNYERLTEYTKETITDQEMEIALRVSGGIQSLTDSIRKLDHLARNSEIEALKKLHIIEDTILPELMLRIDDNTQPIATDYCPEDATEQKDKRSVIPDWLDIDMEDEDWKKLAEAIEAISQNDYQTHQEVRTVVSQDLITIHERLSITNQDHNDLLRENMAKEESDYLLNRLLVNKVNALIEPDFETIEGSIHKF